MNELNSENERLVSKIQILNNELSKGTNERLELEGNLNKANKLIKEMEYRDECGNDEVKIDLEKCKERLIIKEEQLHSEIELRKKLEDELVDISDQLMVGKENWQSTINEKTKVDLEKNNLEKMEHSSMI